MLSKIGVPVKVPLPAVGTNVQEHVFTSIAYGTLSAIMISLDRCEFILHRAERTREVHNVRLAA